MRLTHLKVQGFRCFTEEQRIDFPASGIIPVIGVTRDGGSSGAGKTSVLQAIAYALKFSTFSAGAQQSWVDEAPKLQVELGLETEDLTERLVIRRGKKTAVTLNDAEVATGATAVDEYLQRYFGMLPDLLQVLTFRPQRKPGLFMGLVPSKKRIFLATVLGLKRFEDLADLLTKEVSAAEKQLAIDEGVLKTLSTPDEPLQPEVKAISYADPYFRGDLDVEAPDLGMYDQLILAAKRVLEGCRTELVKAQQLRATEERLEKDGLAKVAADHRLVISAVLLPQPSTEYDQELQVVAGRQAKLLAKRSELQESQRVTEDLYRAAQIRISGFRPVAAVTERNLIECQELIAHLRENRCVTCGQHWHDIAKLGEAEAVAAELRAKLNANNDLVAEATAAGTLAERQLDEHRPALTKLTDGLAQLQARAAELNQLRAEATARDLLAYRQRCSEIDATFVRVTDDVRTGCRAAIDAAIAANETARQRMAEQLAVIKAIEVAKGAAERRCQEQRTQNKLIDGMRRTRNQVLELMAAVQGKVWTGKKTVDEKQDLQTATRAFLGAISNEVLAEISVEANAMMALLPNVKNVGIRFTTETPTEAGNLRQEIRTVMTVGAIDDVDPESQLSGGQLTSVELAVDRAVSKVLRRRQGGQRLPAWLALDEAFDGHDQTTKEACLDFLRTETGDSQVFIIDHASELREAFQHVITVVQADSGTKMLI